VCKEKSGESPESECWALTAVPSRSTPGSSESGTTIRRDGLLDLRSVVRHRKVFVSQWKAVEKWAG
jgi:hypothetical protein